MFHQYLQLKTTTIAKQVSQAWKNLSDEEREEWEEMARKDKARYEMEKTMYNGPWKVVASSKRIKKDGMYIYSGCSSMQHALFSMVPG